VKVEKPKPAVRPAEDDDSDASAFESEAAADDSDTAYIDGSDHEQRHLSKAERKRLKKLARMNGAAA
jgi:hypothetical protein